MFDNAERLSMTVKKLLTGLDAPIGNLEMALTGTYYKAKERFEIQARKANKSSSKGQKG